MDRDGWTGRLDSVRETILTSELSISNPPSPGEKLPVTEAFPQTVGVRCWRLERESDSVAMSHPSPTKSRGSSGSNGDERPRFFDTKAKQACWMKADVLAGRHPDRWRKDAAGNVVCKRFCNCQGCLCFEYDHIVPYSKGGESVAENCQILQTRVNRYKSDKTMVDGSELKGYSCDVQFTDKELDIIEMAVYGDVIRPGNQCRCKTVAEMLGKYKSKDGLAACKLP